jgi:hypothetical protein
MNGEFFQPCLPFLIEIFNPDFCFPLTGNTGSGLLVILLVWQPPSNISTHEMTGKGTPRA